MRTGGLPCFILLVASDLVEIRRRGKTSSPSPRSPWRTLGVASTRAAVVVARAKSTPTASRHGGGWPICAILARPHGLIYIGGAAPSHLSSAPPWRDPPPRAASRAGSPLLRLLGIGPSRRLRPPSARLLPGGPAPPGSAPLRREVAAAVICLSRTTSPAGSAPPQPGLTAPPPTRPLSPSHTCVQVLKRREKG